MSKIKLFSGMDFSGKTTIITTINSEVPNVFKLQKKFLTPIDTIEKVRKLDTWLSAEEWKPLLEKTIKKDIADYREKELILQDTLWIIKYLAIKLEKNNPADYDEIKILTKLLYKYPNMDSFYITTTIDKRIERLNMRQMLGEDITGSDKLLFSEKKFEKVEKIYKKLVLERFPNTQIIETTHNSPEETIKNILNNKKFQKDM